MSEQTSTENVEQSTERPQRKVRRGYVVSDKMDKTVVVLVEERYKHSLYGKVLRRSKKVKVHDEHNEARPGDLVLTVGAGDVTELAGVVLERLAAETD